MNKLHKILEELAEVGGIDVAVCVGRDGFVIDAASTLCSLHIQTRLIH